MPSREGDCNARGREIKRGGQETKKVPNNIKKERWLSQSEAARLGLKKGGRSRVHQDPGQKEEMSDLEP